MSFKNPQRTINKEFDAFIRGGNALTNQIATTTSEIRRGVAAQKKLNQEMQEKDDALMQSLYSKTNEFGKSGNALMDQNMLGFWNSKVDEYFKIKNAMQDGIIGRQEGNQALAKINGLVPQFRQQVAYLAGESQMFNEDSNNNNVSSVGSTQNKVMLQRIHEGGNVQIVEKGGQIYYFSPEQKDEEGNVISEAAMLNGNELIANATAEKKLYERKVNLSSPLTAVYNKAIQPDSLDGKFVDYIKVKKGDINPMTGLPYPGLEEGQVYTFKTITPEKKPQAIEELAKSQGINSLMSNDSSMRRVWQDEIPDEEILRIATEKGYDTSLYEDPWHEFAGDMSQEQIEKVTAEQDDIMRTYLAEKAYNDNANMDNTLKFVKKEVYDPKGENQDGNPYYMETVENVYDFFQNPVDNANLILNSTVNGKTVDDVVVNDDGTVTLVHKDYSLDEGTGGDVVDKITNIATYDPKDPISATKLAQQVQKSIGGNNKDNNQAIMSMTKLYPAYAQQQKLEKEKAKELAEGKGGFGNFPDGDSYEKWKVKNGLDKLTDIEKQFLMQDKRLMFYLRPDVQAKEGYKKSYLNEVEYKVLMAILEQRNATKQLQ
jgi:hypothetical protein